MFDKKLITYFITRVEYDQSKIKIFSQIVIEFLLLFTVYVLENIPAIYIYTL